MALTSSGVRIRGHYEPLMGGVHFVPFPDPLRLGAGSAEAAVDRTMAAIDELFATLCFPDDVAAFLVEPILGEGGYVVPADTFLPRLRQLADQHGILLIADEVQTGFGRTGRFFASEWTGAAPDIVVMAKGIASGMPHVRDHGPPLADRRVHAGTHGGTYGGNAVACAAAVATLDVIADEGLSPTPSARARGCSRACVRLRRPGKRGRGARPRPDGRDRIRRAWLAQATTRSGQGPALGRVRAATIAAVVRHLGQAVRVIPPLVTTEDEIDQALSIIAESLAAIS